MRALIVSLIAAATAVVAPRGDEAVPPLPADLLRDADLVGAAVLGLPDVIPGVDRSAEGNARAALGRKLFFDPILSADKTVSCASCHDPQHGFASPEAKPLGVAGRRAARNAPPAFNRAFGSTHFWDGRAATLEEQALAPIENPDEMNLPIEQAVARLAADPDYKERFAAAGAGEPTKEALAAALAEFMRRLVVGDSPVDRFRAAKGELTPLERRGLWIFESKGRCWRCHSGPNFSDEAFHNTGVGVTDGTPENGRFDVTKADEDRGKFKTPTLRMVAKTAPYMHDGSLATLEEVARFYAQGGKNNPNLDPKMEPMTLSDEDVAALVAFLEALSRPADVPAAQDGDVEDENDDEQPKPKKRRSL